jgi:hypothetical protein
MAIYNAALINAQQTALSDLTPATQMQLEAKKEDLHYVHGAHWKWRFKWRTNAVSQAISKAGEIPINNDTSELFAAKRELV